MLWYPGTGVDGVNEVTENGLTYGLCAAGRLWHGDRLEAGVIVKGAAHDACEALLTKRVAAVQPSL